MASAGTRTFRNATSACPCGASSNPNTGSGRTTSTPGLSIGTSTMDCWRCGAAAPGLLLPMKIATAQRGSQAPEIHHFLRVGGGQQLQEHVRKGLMQQRLHDVLLLLASGVARYIYIRIGPGSPPFQKGHVPLPRPPHPTHLPLST